MKNIPERKENKATHEEVFHRVHLSFYTSGLAKELGATKTHILFAIASYMDEEGKCFPTHLQLSERTGISDKSIGKHVRELINFRIDGKPILLAEKYPTKAGNFNYVYKILPLSQLSKFGEKGIVEKIDPPKTKSEEAKISELERALAKLG